MRRRDGREEEERRGFSSQEVEGFSQQQEEITVTDRESDVEVRNLGAAVLLCTRYSGRWRVRE